MKTLGMIAGFGILYALGSAITVFAGGGELVALVFGLVGAGVSALAF